MKRIIRILTVLLFTLVSISLTKKSNSYLERNENINCNASLTVDKNKSTKSVFKDFIDYKLELTNTSTSVSNYQIKFENLNKDSEEVNMVSKKRKSIETIALNASILDKNKKQVKGITLQPGEIYALNVRISKTKTIGFEKWNFTKVKVISKDCNDVVASTILKTYLPNPSLR